MVEFKAILSQLDRELAARDRIYPKRDQQNDERLKHLFAEFVDLIKAFNGHYGQEKPYLDEGMGRRLAENGLFLCGYMKSGTTLLLELLDDHPEIIALPGDSWFIGSMRRLAKSSDRDRFYAVEFERWLTRLVNPTGQAPFWPLGKQIETYRIFLDRCRYWCEVFGELEVSYLLAIVMSYYEANASRPVSPGLWVEKTPGNEFEVENILTHFPNARFLHIVRDPRENMASVKRLYTNRNWHWDARDTARKLARSCRLAERYAAGLGDGRYRFLRYEDLTENPESVMREVGEFLEIRWDERLLKPTINGMAAQSNTMYDDRQVKGVVRPVTESKWRGVLDAREQNMISAIRWDARRVGYSWEQNWLDIGKGLLEKAWDRTAARLYSR